jgi:GT2 family glycosyltransferase
MTPLTSIIMTTYMQTPFQAHMTMASLANVTRYTDPEDYELILMSDSEQYPVRDEYKVLKIDQYIKTEGVGYTRAMNLGAARAKGEYLVFLQNDVFIWESWLPKLRWYLENAIADCVIPDQCPRDRAFVKMSYNLDMAEGTKFGSRDAGLLMITKDAFKKTGGWNDELSILAEKDFYERMGRTGVKQIDTCKVMISHIMAATNLDRLHKNPEEYESMMKHDVEVLNQ